MSHEIQTTPEAREKLSAVANELLQLAIPIMLARHRILEASNAVPDGIGIDDLALLTRIDDFLKRVIGDLEKMKVASYALKTRQ